MYTKQKLSYDESPKLNTEQILVWAQRNSNTSSTLLRRRQYYKSVKTLCNIFFGPT